MPQAKRVTHASYALAPTRQSARIRAKGLSLLTLPAEIRIMIYRCFLEGEPLALSEYDSDIDATQYPFSSILITGPVSTQAWARTLFNGRWYDHVPKKRTEQLFRIGHVCASIRREALPILYDMCLVAFKFYEGAPQPRSTIKRMVGYVDVGMLRYVQFGVHPLDVLDISPVTMFVEHIKRSRQLRRVEIAFCIDNFRDESMSSAKRRKLIAFVAAMKRLQERCSVCLSLGNTHPQFLWGSSNHTPSWCRSMLDDLEANRLRLQKEKEAARAMGSLLRS